MVQSSAWQERHAERRRALRSAACQAAYVHCPREPAGDDSTNSEYSNQYGSVQKKVFQSLRVSINLERYASPRS